MTAYVFIDLDGTLTDSAPGITEAIVYALDQLGFPRPDEAALRACIGPSLVHMLPGFGVPEEDVARGVALYRAHYNDGGLYNARVYEGVPEMLTTMRSIGFRLALATAKPIAYAPKITAHFGLAEHLDHEFGSMLDGRMSDKRDLLAHALKETGADPAKSFMIGDRRYDALGAVGNGITPIGALWGFGSREELAEAGATHFADMPKDVAGLVEALR